MRLFYFVLAWIFFALGIIGAFLPVMPTTVFMILALWGFSKSSQRFHDWLYQHRLFGPPLQQWSEHRVIPVVAKCSAVTFMLGSLIYLFFFSQSPPWLLISAAGLVAFACWFILTKPSKVPVL